MSKTEDTSPRRFYKGPMIPDALAYVYWAGRGCSPDRDHPSRDSQAAALGHPRARGFPGRRRSNRVQCARACSFDDEGFWLRHRSRLSHRSRKVVAMAGSKEAVVSRRLLVIQATTSESRRGGADQV